MGVDALQGAIRPLDLDSPFVAVAKYHVEDRFFSNCIHSNGLQLVDGRIQARTNSSITKSVSEQEY